MYDSGHHTRNILQVYNCVWLHHELCSKLVTTFHNSMTYNKFFWTYMHALVAHAPQQLEQAQRSATAASNRHPSNVLSTTVLRLQAKAAFKDIADDTQTANSIVGRAAQVQRNDHHQWIHKQLIKELAMSLPKNCTLSPSWKRCVVGGYLQWIPILWW